MSLLRDTQVTGKVSATVAASNPQDYVRLAEFDQRLSGVATAGHTHTASQITDLPSALGLLLAGTLTSSDSVAYAGGQFTVRVKALGGVLSDADGLSIDPTAVSMPGHQHVLADLEDFAGGLSGVLAAQMQATNSIVWAGLAASVQLKVNGALVCDGNGLSVSLGTGTAQAAAGDHTHAQLHDALTVAPSGSLSLALNGQRLTAEVWLASLSGLTRGSGLALDFGTGHYQAARGDHTHTAGGGVSLSVATTSTLALGLSGAQVLSGVVRCDSAPSTGRGKLGSGSAGLYVMLGTTGDTAAAGDHGHSAATTDANGFMSTAQVAKLAGLQNEALVFDTPLVRSGSEIWMPAATASQDGYMTQAQAAKLTGLDATPLTFSAPLTLADHAVSILPATTSAAGSMSSADKSKLNLLDPTPLSFGAPLVLAGHAVSISAATMSAAGTLSSADKTKLDALDATPLTFSGPLSLTGHAVSIDPATDAAAGSLSAADKMKLDAMLSIESVAAPLGLSGTMLTFTGGTGGGVYTFDAPFNVDGSEISLRIAEPLCLLSVAGLNTLWMRAAASDQDGYLSKEDKAKLDGLTAGGGSVYNSGIVTGPLTFQSFYPSMTLTGGGASWDLGVDDSGQLLIKDNGNEAIRFDYAGAALLTVNASLRLNGSLFISGTQVVANQQAAIDDAASATGTATSGGYGFSTATQFNSFVGDLNGAVAQLNRILAALRTHGLIASS